MSSEVQENHKGKKKLAELKNELELDEHKVNLCELYLRYGSDPRKVSLV